MIRDNQKLQNAITHTKRIYEGQRHATKKITQLYDLENTIRYGGSTTQYAAYTVDMVHTLDMVYTVDFGHWTGRIIPHTCYDF